MAGGGRDERRFGGGSRVISLSWSARALMDAGGRWLGGGGRSDGGGSVSERCEGGGRDGLCSGARGAIAAENA
jgi:hypothetical protein